MKYHEKIDDVIRALQEHGHSADVEKLESLKKAAATSNDLLMNVTHELLLIIHKHDGDKVADVIRKDVLELRNYCYSKGLRVH